ncbi:MAG: LysE family transporter [Chloroflexota bacterium]|nr:LysE family transporter [Chloroflexota bacterium]
MSTMMSFLFFLSEAVFISLSGVMAPGPITAVAVGKGSEKPAAGVWIAVGHGLVEIPLMLAVYFGIGHLFENEGVKAAVGILGGLFILWMGIGMLRGIRQGAIPPGGEFRSPLVAGIILSIGNPYFLIWWLTVGAALILRSVEYGFLGFIAFAIGHWLCDLLWDSFLSVLSFHGGQFFGKRFQQTVFALSGIMLLFFGGKLIWSSVAALLA